MESGYDLKSTKTSGYEQQSLSPLYEEGKIHSPISLVRSRLSSIGQKVKGKGKDNADDDDDDDLSTIAKMLEAQYFCFFCGIDET